MSTKNLLALDLVVFKGVRKKSKIKGALFSRLSKRTFDFGGVKKYPQSRREQAQEAKLKSALEALIKKNSCFIV